MDRVRAVPVIALALFVAALSPLPAETKDGITLQLT
jgi:hypothetical protein